MPMRDVLEMQPTACVRQQAAPPMLPLEIRGLTLQVSGKALLDGINVNLQDNGITTIMGPNGAGKSLLLRLVHGLITPSAGEIHWGGQPLSAAMRRRQAMVFQKPVLLRRSVAANIEFVLGRKARRAKREALLEHVGLLDRGRQPARLLSGGEQQRLALARALAIEPEVLLLDEPTASLDPGSTLAIEEIVRAAHEDGTKIIFVTHDVGQAKRLADDIVFLDHGRLSEHVPARQFFANPASEAARAFLEGRLVA